MLPRFPTTSATWATGGVSRGFSWGSGRPWKHCSAKPMSYHNSKRSGIKIIKPWWNSLMITWWNDTTNIDIDQWKLKWRVLIKTYENWWMMVTVACFLMFFSLPGSWRTFHWWNLAPFHSISELSQHMDLIITYDNYSAIVITKLTIITI